MNNLENNHSHRMTFWERIYLPEIAKGLALTFRQMTRPKMTRFYPEERFVPGGSYRGRPVLVLEESGERCVAGETTTRDKERYPAKFEINMLRCIFCGFCEEVCPEEAIVMSRDNEMVYTNREDAILGKEKLLVPISQLQDRLEYLRTHQYYEPAA
jgi:NADH-quinone oxidoreductase subunit I